MIRYLVKYKVFMCLTIMFFSSIMASAESKTVNGVHVQYEQMGDGTIKVINVRNGSDEQIVLNIDGQTIRINAGGSDQPYRRARKFVRIDYPGKNGPKLWEYSELKKVEDPETEIESIVVEDNTLAEKEPVQKPESVRPERKSVKQSASTSSYFDKLDQDDFFGQDAVNAYVRKINSLCISLSSSKNKEQFIIDQNINEILKQSKLELELKESGIPLTAQELISDVNVSAYNRVSLINNIKEILSNRLRSRKEACSKLESLVAETSSKPVTTHILSGDIINYSVLGVVIILIVILTVIATRRKNKRNNKPNGIDLNSKSYSQTMATDNQAIVVRRRTTSILKKQCIDDVVDNPAYMVINTAEFAPNSAVRKIFIKNTCIKEVYDLYADNLRNSDKPKEDGCMVLGRWVYDENNHCYDISLEDVVLPGDDAVFKEYELNFGGKIKLRVAEKLRKLRRETNLQYDLVCWIHSHPGLGVFFSNSDDNVQMQLKHPQHPNFLVAFVVDILTSDQELGIFTFRNDGTMNSRGDITKMFSLEEMYKWALQSERDSFSRENYFNLLESAKLKVPSCMGVEVNNSSIIDSTQIVINPGTGIVGWAVGTTVESEGSQEFVVSGFIKDSEKPMTGIIGCLINVSYLSLPTIQRLVSTEIGNLSFVVVYSSKEMTLTTIPVINGELLTDEQFYGNVTIDELKIWTRRKR